MSAMTTQLLSNGEFCKLRYDTVPVKSATATFLSIPVTQKCQILSCDTRVTNERYDAQTGFDWLNAGPKGGALQTVTSFRVYKFRSIFGMSDYCLREYSASSGRSLRQNCTLPELYTTL
jgi:hypothetical protein